MKKTLVLVAALGAMAFGSSAGNAAPAGTIYKPAGGAPLVEQVARVRVCVWRHRHRHCYWVNRHHHRHHHWRKRNGVWIRIY